MDDFVGWVTFNVPCGVMLNYNLYHFGFTVLKSSFGVDWAIRLDDQVEADLIPIDRSKKTNMYIYLGLVVTSPLPLMHRYQHWC